MGLGICDTLRARRGLPVGALLCIVVAGCTSRAPEAVPLRIPHGALARLEVEVDGQLYGFGPFVGYYFRPERAGDLSRLSFVCLNEEGFYSSDAPRNQLLFEGEAVLTRLPESPSSIPGGEARIQPVFFLEAPASWLETRPAPPKEFLHFHSCYDDQGATLVGYWLRHVARRSFTYDMGGRVNASSALYHTVSPGPDRAFARIVEFDRGPVPKGERIEP